MHETKEWPESNGARARLLMPRDNAPRQDSVDAIAIIADEIENCRNIICCKIFCIKYSITNNVFATLDNLLEARAIISFRFAPPLANIILLR